MHAGSFYSLTTGVFSSKAGLSMSGTMSVMLMITCALFITSRSVSMFKVTVIFMPMAISTVTGSSSRLVFRRRPSSLRCLFAIV